jgi:integrase
MVDHSAPSPTWTPEQLGRFVDQVLDDRFLSLWMLLATTGLPVTAALNLRRSDVDVQRHHVSTAALTRRGEGGPRGPRIYELDPDAYDALRDHVISWDKERAVLQQKSRHLFVWSNGEQLDRGAVRKMFQQHCTAAGVPVVPYKEMRFAYVVAALESGLPTQVIRERLGRKPEQSTEHDAPQRVTDVAQPRSARRQPWRSRSF